MYLGVGTIRYPGIKFTKKLNYLVRVNVVPLINEVSKQLEQWNKKEL